MWACGHPDPGSRRLRHKRHSCRDLTSSAPRRVGSDHRASTAPTSSLLAPRPRPGTHQAVAHFRHGLAGQRRDGDPEGERQQRRVEHPADTHHRDADRADLTRHRDDHRDQARDGPTELEPGLEPGEGPAPVGGRRLLLEDRLETHTADRRRHVDDERQGDERPHRAHDGGAGGRDHRETERTEQHPPLTEANRARRREVAGEAPDCSRAHGAGWTDIVTMRSLDGGRTWAPFKGAPGGEDYQGGCDNPRQHRHRVAIRAIRVRS